jgi:threonine aldolase
MGEFPWAHGRTIITTRAMLNAELGDDVFGDDPTVIELEKMCAATFGKPAGLFVPSGTMGNLIAVMTHCNERASELIMATRCLNTNTKP